MFYVSISRDVLDKVKEEAKDTENEIIGILVGTIEDHTIVITDAVSGEQEQESTRATLPPTTIAKVTDKILKGEISGRIVGWYHSHPGFGIFMSHTDINTQNNLQQFSSKVTALIVDPEDDDFGFFTLHNEQGVIQLEKNQIHVYDEGEEKIPEHFSEPPKLPKKPPKKTRQVRGVMPPPEEHRGPSKIIIIAIVAVAILASVSFLILVDEYIQEPDISTVDGFVFLGNYTKSTQGIPIFSGNMTISVNVTVMKGRINQEGVKFHISNHSGAWDLITNVLPQANRTYIFRYNTSGFDEGSHKILVNFTDSLNLTWQGLSDFFIIDNIEDKPMIWFIDPDPETEIGGNTTLLTEFIDPENNMHNVSFFSSWEGGNFSRINNSYLIPDEPYYKVVFNTNSIPNGNVTLKVKALDKNRYIGTDEIKVIVSNGE